MIEDHMNVPLHDTKNRPIVTFFMLGTMSFLFLAMTALGGSENPEVLMRFGAMSGPIIASGEYWRLFTAMFIHIGFAHFAFNGISLFIFGRLTENLFGKTRFTAIYVLAGLLGSVASYTFLNAMTIAAGASGAIFGILGALAAYFFVQQKLFGQLAKGNLTGILILATVNLAYGLVTPAIDNWAHLAGFISGLGLGYILAPRYKIVTSVHGTTELVDSNSMLKSIWIVPIVMIIAGGAVILSEPAEATYPHSQVSSAEKYYQQKQYRKALAELETAISENPSSYNTQTMHLMARAYLLRGRIHLETGDLDAAIADLAVAVRWGDPETKEVASQILVSINFKG